MSVRDICVRDVDTAEFTESAWSAAERMHQRAVGALVVVDSTQRPIGILTDRDIVERVVAGNRDPHATTIGQVMTTQPAIVNEATSITQALSVMRAEQCRRLPIVDDDGRMVGILSMDDILLALSDQYAMIGQIVERETPPSIARQ